MRDTLAPGAPEDRAEGFRYLLRFLAAGINLCVEHGDPETLLGTTLPLGEEPADPSDETARQPAWDVRLTVPTARCSVNRASILGSFVSQREGSATGMAVEDSHGW